MQVSWIDPEDLSRLAADLFAPLPPDLAPEQGFLPGLTFVEPDGSVTLVPPFAAKVEDEKPDDFAHAPNSPPKEILHIREQLRLIRERASKAGLLAQPHQEPPAAAPAPVPETPPPSVKFLPLNGPMSERLQAFTKWVARLAASEEVLILDDQGELLQSLGPRSDLTMSALLALTSTLRSSALGISETPEIIRHKLGAQKELSVLPCLTRHGMASLAIVNAAGIPQESVSWLREALTLTIEGQDGEQR